MTWLQILGLILMILPLVGVLIFGFIMDWKGALFALAVLGIIFLGGFLLGGGL
mgnify:CR=1 FL=1